MADAEHRSIPNVTPAAPPAPRRVLGAGPRRSRRPRGERPSASLPIAERYAASEPSAPTPATSPIPVRTVEEARALARERFRDRVRAGEKVGDCDCHSGASSDATAARADAGPSARVAGVRFRDSGRLYYFDAGDGSLEPGDWVVVETERGEEAGRVIIAPQQMLLSQLDGELRPVLRQLGEDDVARMDRLKRESADAVRIFGEKVRAHRVPVKPVSATFAFDGSTLTFAYAPHQGAERPDLGALGRDLAATFSCRVDLRAVTPREEARLLGGLGRCGRTLCCSSWLPVFPEITMGMVRNQDLALNPSKVSGVCGRLLCCLSYENEQYKQIKAVLPRLGQHIETPNGRGQVVSLKVLSQEVTVRLDVSGEQETFPSGELDTRPAAHSSGDADVRAGSAVTADDVPGAGPLRENGPGAGRSARLEDALAIAADVAGRLGAERSAADPAPEHADSAEPVSPTAGQTESGDTRRRRRRRRSRPTEA